MDSADNVLARLMIDYAVRIFAAKAAMDIMAVYAKQADFVGYRFTNEALNHLLVNAEYNAGNDIALTLYGTDDRSLKRIVTALSTALIPVAVLILTANVSLVDLNNAAQLVHVLFDQGCLYFVTHEPSGFVTTEPHKAHDLQCAHAVLAGEHEMGDAEPVAERRRNRQLQLKGIR